MNQFVLMGRLTKDPEVKSCTSTKVVRYTLACDNPFGKDGAADFLPVVVFGKEAEFANKYFKKGIKVLVTGKIEPRSYTDKDGNKNYSMDLVVNHQEFVKENRKNSKWKEG